MKYYQYKIQWLADAKEAIQLLKVIGARSLTIINARDRSTNDLKIVSSYSSMIQYEGSEATKKAIQWIKNQNQINRELDFELIRH